MASERIELWTSASWGPRAILLHHDASRGPKSSSVTTISSQLGSITDNGERHARPLRWIKFLLLHERVLTDLGYPYVRIGISNFLWGLNLGQYIQPTAVFLDDPSDIGNRDVLPFEPVLTQAPDGECGAPVPVHEGVEGRDHLGELVDALGPPQVGVVPGALGGPPCINNHLVDLDGQVPEFLTSYVALVFWHGPFPPR